MMVRAGFALMGAVLAAGAFVAPADAQGRKGDRGSSQWENLGCVEVSRREDRDVVQVGRKEGRYKAIRLSAKGGDVDIEDLKVVYANGEPDDIRVRSELQRGKETRALDLKGRERAIDRIEIVTKRDGKGRDGKGRRGRPELCIAGLQDDRRDERRGDKGRGEELGCQKVGFLADRDVVKVGRKEGRFKAIRLEVADNMVFMKDLKVIYANGDADDLQVRSEIRAGGETRWLDLKGRERAIDRIEMTYASKPSFKGQARVCVYGRD